MRFLFKLALAVTLVVAVAAADESPGFFSSMGGPNGIMGGGMQQIAPQIQGNIASAKGRSGSVSHLKTDNLKPQSVKLGGFAGWKLTVPGNRALATPAVVDGVAYIGGGFGSHEFYAFDARTGKAHWAIKVSDDGPTAAVVEDGYVAFNTESCTLFVVEADTGKMVWSRWLGDPLMSQPGIAHGTVLMAYPGGRGHILTAIELASGKEAWETAIAGDIITAPVIEGDSVYLSTFNGTVYKYGLDDGRELWKKEMNATSAPWIVGDDVYVSKREAGKDGDTSPSEGIANLEGVKGKQKNEDLWGFRKARYLDRHVQSKSVYHLENSADDSSVGFAVAPATAKTGDASSNVGQGTVRGLWEFQGSRPTYVDGLLFTTFGDAIACIDPASEKVLWEQKIEGDLDRLGGHGASPPAAAGGKLYIGTATGYVMAYDQQTGDQLWRVNIGEKIRFQPSVTDGWLYVGTAAGNLFALDLDDSSADGWPMWGGSPAHNGPR